jgi:hypothetical protein
MAYTLFNGALPNGASQNGTQFGQSARDNLNAVRDACILGGGFPGFNMASNVTPTAAQPTQLLYSKGTERVRATLTWGTVGGEAGNVTVAVYAYSANSGADYTTTPNGAIGTKTITYDGSGNVTATTWSYP